MKTKFGIAAQALRITERQSEVIIGSLLGDATLLKTTAGYCFRVHHGLAQRSLVQWKYEQVRDFVRTSPRNCGQAWYFRTVTHPYFSDLRAHFYRFGVKIVPLDLLAHSLSALGLAVWVMDDGSRDGNQLRINTQSFRIEEVDFLRDLLLRKFGLLATVNLDKGSPRLRFKAASMKRLTSLLEPHIIKDMRYKIEARPAP